MNNEEYYTPSMLQKISNECKYRECAIFKKKEEGGIAKIRPLNIYKSKHLDFLFENYQLYKNRFDIYITNSCCRMPHLLPSTKQNNVINQKTMQKLWDAYYAGENPTFCSQYDFFIDVDVTENCDESEFELVLGWAKQLKKTLDPWIGYIEIWNTGRGLHLIHKKISYTPKQIENMVKKVCHKNKIPLASINEERPNVDDRMYQPRRIRRVPWSLHSVTGRPMRKIY